MSIFLISLKILYDIILRQQFRFSKVNTIDEYFCVFFMISILFIGHSCFITHWKSWYMAFNNIHRKKTCYWCHSKYLYMHIFFCMIWSKVRLSNKQSNLLWPIKVLCKYSDDLMIFWRKKFPLHLLGKWRGRDREYWILIHLFHANYI